MTPSGQSARSRVQGGCRGKLGRVGGCGGRARPRLLSGYTYRLTRTKRVHDEVHSSNATKSGGIPVLCKHHVDATWAHMHIVKGLTT
jgi:hypothetical protein